MMVDCGNCSFDWCSRMKMSDLQAILVKKGKRGQHPSCYYSYRKASTGSSFDAFFAG
jgi:hypothetical protein